MTHDGRKAAYYSLDLTTESEHGPNGCGGNQNAAAGQPVLAPENGTVERWSNDLVCLSFDSGGSALIGHMKVTNRVPVGTRVQAGDLLGVVSKARETANGNYAHIHVQVHNETNCRGSAVPFTGRNKFDSTPALPDLGNKFNQHAGVALTRR